MLVDIVSFTATSWCICLSCIFMSLVHNTSEPQRSIVVEICVYVSFRIINTKWDEILNRICINNFWGFYNLEIHQIMFHYIIPTYCKYYTLISQHENNRYILCILFVHVKVWNQINEFYHSYLKGKYCGLLGCHIMYRLPTKTRWGSYQGPLCTM